MRLQRGEMIQVGLAGWIADPGRQVSMEGCSRQGSSMKHGDTRQYTADIRARFVQVVILNL